jgi:hypothetical protein
VYDVQKYPACVRALLAEPFVAPLDAGPRDAGRVRQLADLGPGDVVGQRMPAEPEMAQACLAGLWLYVGHLDASHELSQQIDTTTGSYWHAIMHRREGDFENSKYWFRRVGPHPAMTTLLAELRTTDLAHEPAEVRQLCSAAKWDPFRFVDLCRAAVGGRTELIEACRNIQSREWQTLFDFCFESARAVA